MHPFILPFIDARLLRRAARWWIVLLLVCSQTAIGLAEDNGEIVRISVHQVKKLLDHPDTVIIDVRTYRNWWRSSKKIPTAVREDPSKVDQWREKYLKDQTLIFYCS
jgi:hypothetical protein